MDNQKEHLDYLFRSLQHHPSPYLIYELDGSLKWSNLAARYIFRMDNLKDLSIKNIDQESIANGVNKDPIAQSYETPIEIQLRDITFFIRTRVHLIPIEKSEGFFLIEILCPSRTNQILWHSSLRSHCIVFSHQRQLSKTAKP